MAAETRTPALIVQDSPEPATTFAVFLAQGLEQWGFEVARDAKLGEGHILWVQGGELRFNVHVQRRAS